MSIYKIKILVLILSLFPLLLIAGPKGVDSKLPHSDPLIDTIKSGSDEADEKIRDLLMRRRQSAEAGTPFQVPEFEVLVSNIEEDINCWLEHGQLQQNESDILRRLLEYAAGLRKRGFPYEDTVYTAARYTLIITLLHEREMGEINKDPGAHKYRGELNLTADIIMREDFFFNDQYLSTTEESLFRGMLDLPELLENKTIMLYPEHDPLTEDDFITTYPYPFYMLGVSRSAIIVADNSRMSSGVFFGHDLDHTAQMLACLKKEFENIVTENIPHREVQVMDRRRKMRNQGRAIIYELEGRDAEASNNLRVTLFDVMHEICRPNLPGSFFCPSFFCRTTTSRLANIAYTYLNAFIDWCDDKNVGKEHAMKDMQELASRFMEEKQGQIEKKLSNDLKWFLFYQKFYGNEKFCELYYKTGSEEVACSDPELLHDIQLRTIWRYGLKRQTQLRWLIRKIERLDSGFFTALGTAAAFYIYDFSHQ